MQLQEGSEQNRTRQESPKGIKSQPPAKEGGESKSNEERKSGNKFSGAACKFDVVEFVRQQDTEQLNDTGEEKISFGGQYVGCFSVGNTQSILQRVNGAFHTGAAIVNQRKRGIIPGNAGAEPQIFVERDINAAPIF